MNRHLSLIPALCLASFSAYAELSCRDLAVIAQSTIEQRNLGASLLTLLGEAEKDEMKRRYTTAELEAVRQAIRGIYTSEYSPGQLLEACQKNSGTQRSRP